LEGKLGQWKNACGIGTIEGLFHNTSPTLNYSIFAPANCRKTPLHHLPSEPTPSSLNYCMLSPPLCAFPLNETHLS